MSTRRTSNYSPPRTRSSAGRTRSRNPTTTMRKTMSADEALPDPDDWEAMDEAQQEIREFMAAASLDLDQARRLVADLLGFNRVTADALLGIALVLERGVKIPRKKLGAHLREMGESVEKLTVPREEDE